MDPTNEVGQCTICLNAIDPKAVHDQEKEQKLDCSHVFHRECIGEWLKLKHNCPLCRAKVQVLTPEAPRTEMTREEILAVPDDQRPDQDLPIAEMLNSIRVAINRMRAIRRLDLNEDTPVAATARKVDSVAGKFFGW